MSDYRGLLAEIDADNRKRAEYEKKLDTMIKDGRRYLVHLIWKKHREPLPDSNWEILHWGIPNAISSRDGGTAWINESCFAIRMESCVFDEIYELDRSVQLLRCIALASKT